MSICNRLLLAVFMLPLLAVAQEAVPVKIVPVAGSVTMFEGAGGNIGVSSGPDGVVMIDDQYAVMTPNIRKALKTLGPKPLRFIINTHWHGDHTGGNASFGETGTVIVAHDNVRKRLGSDQFITETVPIDRIPEADDGLIPGQEGEAGAATQDLF